MSVETLGKRIRNAELERVPYVVVLGDQRGRLGNTLSLRIRGRREVVVTGASRSVGRDRASCYAVTLQAGAISSSPPGP